MGEYPERSMSMKQKSIIAVTICSVLLSIGFYPFLPHSIPMHWNAQGVIDGRYPKMTIFMIPALMIVIVLLFKVIRFIDPKNKNYKKFSSTFDMIKLVICLLILCLQIVTIINSFDEHLVDVPMILNMGMGMLFAILGNSLPKIRPNYFVGIKTPWALADEDNWRITHRFAGKVWFIGGLIMFPTALLPASIAMYVILAIAIGLCVISYVYSYYIFRKKEKEEKNL